MSDTFRKVCDTMADSSLSNYWFFTGSKRYLRMHLAVVVLRGFGLYFRVSQARGILCLYCCWEVPRGLVSQLSYSMG